MPELPEVETITRSLASVVIDFTIDDIIFSDKNLRFSCNKKAIKKQISQKKIVKIYRKAKYINIMLSDNSFLVIHLGMTGNFRFAKNYEKIKHDHIIFELHKNAEKLYLIYNDVRRFGFINYQNNQAELDIFYKNTAKDIFDFSDQEFYEILQSNAPIKNLLLNQKKIAGVGNIYALEALFEAGILPSKIAKNIEPAKSSVLLTSLKKIMHESIKIGGTTIKDFKNTKGEQGYFALQLKVYGKDECKKCKTKITREKYSGRSNYYCKKCQK